MNTCIIADFPGLSSDFFKFFANFLRFRETRRPRVSKTTQTPSLRAEKENGKRREEGRRFHENAENVERRGGVS